MNDMKLTMKISLAQMDDTGRYVTSLYSCLQKKNQIMGEKEIKIEWMDLRTVIFTHFFCPWTWSTYTYSNIE